MEVAENRETNDSRSDMVKSTIMMSVVMMGIEGDRISGDYG